MRLQHTIAILLLFAMLLPSCKEELLPNRELPTLSVQAAEVQEGNIDVTLDVTVTLTGDNPTNVVVDYSTLGKTATSGEDYEGAIGELVFRPGETQKTITIIIKGDFITEATETFDFILLNPVNATFVDSDRATCSILDDDDGFTNSLTIPTVGYETPLVYPGLSLVWADEFQGTGLNLDDWTHEIGNGASGWGNNELQYYQESNTYTAADDYLVIEAKEQSVGGFDYTSSRIITKGKQEFQYGRVDIRAALPKGRGLWPALWMLGSNFDSAGWPACGEIDIMEMLGHSNNIVHGTVHFGADFSQHSSAGASRITPSGYTFDEAFHVFSLIWEEDHIQILVDDVMYLDVTPDALNGQPWPFNQPYFFIFNVAVGGDWPGSPDENTVFPQYMVVDYVRVFQ